MGARARGEHERGMRGEREEHECEGSTNEYEESTRGERGQHENEGVREEHESSVSARGA